MEENKNDHIWNVIPEFFFDLISRIPAGMFLIFLLSEFVFPSMKSYFFMNLDFSELFVLILFGYSLGILMSSPAKLLGKLYFERVWKNKLKNYRQIIYTYLSRNPIDGLEINTPKDLDDLKGNAWMVICKHPIKPIL